MSPAMAVSTSTSFRFRTGLPFFTVRWSVLPDEGGFASPEEMERSLANLRQWVAMIAAFYDGLKDARLPDEVCNRVVTDWAYAQWLPEPEDEG
jgi:hypothetical protein